MNQKYIMIFLVLTCLSQYVISDRCRTSTAKLRDIARRSCGILRVPDMIDIPKKRGSHDKDASSPDGTPFHVIHHEGGQIKFSLDDQSGATGNRLRRSPNPAVKVVLECNDKRDTFLC